jgi:alkaline phosphatase
MSQPRAKEPIMSELDILLTEARRIAGQSVTDRLEGKQAEEARSVVLRLLEGTGLDYVEALRLMSAIQNERWNSAFNAGWEAARRTT